MIYNKILPKFFGTFIRWLNDEEFLVDINGKILIGHKDFWTGEFPDKED